MGIRIIAYVYVASPDRDEGFLAAEVRVDERVALDVVVAALTPEGWSSHVNPDWARPFNLVGWTGEGGRDPITRWERDRGPDALPVD
ncbi:MAG: hypothetical protein ABWY36_05390 [Leifsonia sp.]